MKKLLLLTKSLLAAVLLMGGANSAWGVEISKTYKLSTGDTFTSGQSVEVSTAKHGVVATITYGEAGGADFAAAAANGDVTGFTAFTAGNGTNGNSAGGTFYTIVPKFDGTLTVAVVINQDRGLIVEENGVTMAGFDGTTNKEASKLYGTKSFTVKADQSYKVYVSGSKLGFYGFTFDFDDGLAKITYDFKSAVESGGIPASSLTKGTSAGTNNSTTIYYPNELYSELGNRFAFQIREKTVSEKLQTNAWAVDKSRNGLWVNCATGTDDYISILNLKAGDKITMTIATGKIKFSNVVNVKDSEGNTPAAWSYVVSDEEYTVQADGKLDMQAMKYGNGGNAHLAFSKIVIETTDVAAAIDAVKRNENSSAFATALDAESFSTAKEVYAFHTAWQVAQAKASGSTDITKVIRNSAIASSTDWVGSRVIELGDQKYTGAPDNFLIDANNQEMDTYQMIYGLPAGKYTIKAATRATAAVESGIIYVYSEGQVNKNAAGNHVGNTGGDLDNGWSWTSIDFELTSTSDVKIGYYVNATGSGKWASCDDWHLTKTGDIVKLNAAGYATYSANYDVEVSGAKAYTAVLDFGGKTITCSEITSNKVPAGNGVLLYGDDNADVTLSITVDAAALGDNNLKATTLADGSLATKGVNSYYALDGDTFKQYTGAAFVHNKAYFEVEGSTVLARSMSIVFGDKVTGVENVEAASEAKAKEGKFIECNQLFIYKNGVKYNAAGQQVK